MPPVELDEVADDGQPEPEAAVGPRPASADLRKVIEDVSKRVRLDADPGVTHDELGVIAVTVQRDIDAATGRGEFHGIREQVDDDLLEARGIAKDEADVRVEAAAERELLRADVALERIDGISDEGNELDGLLVEMELAGLDPSDIEEVIDQLGLEHGVAMDDVERVRRPLRRHVPVPQHLDPAQHRAQRRT